MNFDRPARSCGTSEVRRRHIFMTGNEPEDLPISQSPVKDSEWAADRAQLFDILTRAGLQGRDAHVFTQLVEEMASANLIHRFESKLEAQNAKLDAQTSKFNLLLWFVGTGVAALIAIAAALLA